MDEALLNALKSLPQPKFDIIAAHQSVMQYYKIADPGEQYELNPKLSNLTFFILDKALAECEKEKEEESEARKLLMQDVECATAFTKRIKDVIERSKMLLAIDHVQDVPEFKQKMRQLCDDTCQLTKEQSVQNQEDALKFCSYPHLLKSLMNQRTVWEKEQELLSNELTEVACAIQKKFGNIL